MKLIYFLLITLEVAIFCFILFVVYSFTTVVYDVWEIGGLYPLLYADVVGHLLILMFSLGCLYFSIKAANKIKNQ